MLTCGNLWWFNIIYCIVFEPANSSQNSSSRENSLKGNAKLEGRGWAEEALPGQPEGPTQRLLSTQSPGRYLLLITLPGAAKIQQEQWDEWKWQIRKARATSTGSTASALHVGGTSLPGLVSLATSGLSKTIYPDVNGHIRESNEG